MSNVQLKIAIYRVNEGTSHTLRLKHFIFYSLRSLEYSTYDCFFRSISLPFLARTHLARLALFRCRSKTMNPELQSSHLLLNTFYFYFVK
jgi:hypothetical protein